jgi:hypothetical protein
VSKLAIDSPGHGDHKPPKKWRIWLAVTIGLLLCGVGMWWVMSNWSLGNSGTILLKLCWLALYVVVSYRINPKPDYSDVGWLGGLLNNPFRLSDNYNRWQSYLQAVLLPGKLMAYSLALTVFIGQHIYKRVKE